MTQKTKPIALVTGAATGIGRACAKALNHAGFTMALHFNNSHKPAQELASELDNAFLIQADLSQSEGIATVYDALKERGGLEVLVNNAGIAIDAPLFRATVDDFEQVVATNMRSVWMLTRRLMRLMMRKKRGRIINMSSVIGSTGNPGQSTYGMTKAAIENFTKTAAMELGAYNILVNAVAPGFIATGMTNGLSDEVRQNILERVPLGRMGQPEEVAEVVLFLAKGAHYCTGATFHVNGGLYGG